jgi:hypothetical protein
MMYKVQKIIEINQYAIVCQLNTGIKKKIEILPLIENHAHLNGINQLKEKAIFEKVAIGTMGELYWENLILSKSNEKWNYDISPEYIYNFGLALD